MEIFPVYYSCHPQWTRRCQYNSQSPYLMRDLAAMLLSEAMSSNTCNRQFTLREPDKWTRKMKLTNFHPDEVKISVNDDTVKIHAKHIIGDESDFDSYEVRRAIKIPENVDGKNISVKMNNNGSLIIEGPIISTEEKPVYTNQTAATSQNVYELKNNPDKVENDTESQETDDSKDFEMSLNLANFEPSDVSVTCEDNILKVKAKSEHKENGFESSRYFYRECTLPQNVDVSDIKCIRADNGTVSVRVPRVNKNLVTSIVNDASVEKSEQNDSIFVEKEEKDVKEDVTIKDESAVESNDIEKGDDKGKSGI